MSYSGNKKTSQRFLERLSREDTKQMSEVSVVTSPGAKAGAWAVKVKSLSSYNIYNVRMVVVSGVGLEPVEIGGQMQAYNLAEPFTSTGQLPEDTYALMSRVGNKNAFYVPV